MNSDAVYVCQTLNYNLILGIIVGFVIVKKLNKLLRTALFVDFGKEAK